jgi:hypothetical protein
MGGFIRFADGDWAWSSSATRILFNLLTSRLPKGERRARVAVLRDHNVLMLDLRDPAEADLVDVIVDDLPAYLAAAVDSDVAAALAPGFAELSWLAALQRHHNTVRGVSPHDVVEGGSAEGP